MFVLKDRAMAYAPPFFFFLFPKFVAFNNDKNLIKTKVELFTNIKTLLTFVNEINLFIN